MIKIKDSWGITIASIIIALCTLITLSYFKKAFDPLWYVIQNNTNDDYSYNAILGGTAYDSGLEYPDQFIKNTVLPAQSESSFVRPDERYLESIVLYQNSEWLGCFMVEATTPRETWFKNELIVLVSDLKKRCE